MGSMGGRSGSARSLTGKSGSLKQSLPITEKIPIPAILDWKTRIARGIERPIKPRDDFIGYVSERDIEVTYKRSDIIYGEQNVSGLVGKDKRFTNKKRSKMLGSGKRRKVKLM